MSRPLKLVEAHHLLSIRMERQDSRLHWVSLTHDRRLGQLLTHCRSSRSQIQPTNLFEYPRTSGIRTTHHLAHHMLGSLRREAAFAGG